MMAITFMSAPHFRWSFADAHCSRMHPGTRERIDFIYLCQQSRPCAFTCVRTDFLVFLRQRFIPQVFPAGGMLMSGLPTVRRSLRYLRVVPQAKPRNDPDTAFLATGPLSSRRRGRNGE